MPWEAHAVLPVDLHTVLCDVTQSDQPREKSGEMGLIAYVKMHRFFFLNILPGNVAAGKGLWKPQPYRISFHTGTSRVGSAEVQNESS